MINILSVVAVCGIAVATMAMVCTMSVFNGFHALVEKMYCSFDPQLKITSSTGRVFVPDSPAFQKVLNLKEIQVYTKTLEDNVLIKYDDRQVPAILKGVSDNYKEQTRIDSLVVDGRFKLEKFDVNYGNLGVGLAINLGVNSGFVYPMEIFAPSREGEVDMMDPTHSFSEQDLYIGGVFSVSQENYDSKYIIAPLKVARDLFHYNKEVSGIEIKLKSGASVENVKNRIKSLLGTNFKVQDQYEQQESAYKMINIEKYMTFLILSFILIIAVFNVIGSLSMLIVEKGKDIDTLRKLGANNKQISRIFLLEGGMISIIGAVSGIILGLGLCWLQVRFGLIKLGSSSSTFVVSAYPVRIHMDDQIFIFLTVILIGFLATLYPVRYLSRRILKK